MAEEFTRRRYVPPTADQALGLGTRTPIRFGFSLGKMVNKNMKDYHLFADYVSPRYLIYIYKRTIGDKWLNFVLFQAARFQGTLTIEIAICKREAYPYFPVSMEPSLAVDGARERLGYIMFKQDKWWDYHSSTELEQYLNDLTGELLGRGVYIMLDSYAPKLEGDLAYWKRYYQDWQEKEEQNKQLPLGKRFGDIMEEDSLARHLKDSLDKGSYDRWLGGKIKQKYLEDEKRQSCHVYLMGKLMQLPNIDNLVGVRPKLNAYKDDEIAVVLGRWPDFAYFLRNKKLEAKRIYYCFMKTVEILEALYKP